MLNHEQPQEPFSQPAALVRVTPEELAAAISRLEARRAGADGKIAIGDAVNELSLDATPEEVLAEVQAGRMTAARQSSPQAVQRKGVSSRERVGLLLAGGAIVWGLMGYFLSSSPPSAPPAAVSPNISDSPPSQSLALNPNLLVGDRAGKMVLLSEVSDNQPVYCRCGYGSLQPYSPGQGTQWTLIKHNGMTYMRGWISKMSPAVLAQDGAEVSANGDSAYAVRITLPVSGFDVSTEVSTPDGSDTRFHARHIRLDQHAYEKWQNSDKVVK